MEKLVESVLTNVDPFIDEVIRYSVRLGGKRLRPALVFLAGKAVGTLTEHHVQTAAAIEFVHTATLIHDDILDGASMRRHLETINLRWNAQIGVLAGDLLLTKALELMAQSNETFGVRRLTNACEKTCEGELRQIGAVGRFDMTPEEYYEIIGGKTAPLLSCSAELGAHYAGAAKDVTEKFRLFGEKIGLAFQMIDDILDLVGETDTAGKTLRTDLINHKPTLPLILYLRDANEKDKKDMLVRIRRDDFDEQSAVWVIDRLGKAGAIDAAQHAAQQLVDDAGKLISGIKGHSGATDTLATDALLAIAQFVTARKK
ncbi:polyprenyl synthetase [Planctomycetales bacterium]|nr:polyprenyl synthetase [Planctomycetales bacterium]